MNYVTLTDPRGTVVRFSTKKLIHPGFKGDFVGRSEHARLFGVQYSETDYEYTVVPTRGRRYIVRQSGSAYVSHGTFQCRTTCSQCAASRSAIPENIGHFSINTLRQYSILFAFTNEAKDAFSSKDTMLAYVKNVVNQLNYVYQNNMMVTFVIDEAQHLQVFDEYIPQETFSDLSADSDHRFFTYSASIRHVLGYSGGNNTGIAHLNSLCNPGALNIGYTAVVGTDSDHVNIVDYISHEVGHQFGCNHVMANCQNEALLLEPNSGSTIMSYSGLCEVNVQDNSDAYFNSYNLWEAKQHMEAASCAEPLTDSVPLAVIHDSYRIVPIPRATPYELDAAVTLGGDIDSMRQNALAGNADIRDILTLKFLGRAPALYTWEGANHSLVRSLITEKTSRAFIAEECPPFNAESGNGTFTLVLKDSYGDGWADDSGVADLILRITETSTGTVIAEYSLQDGMESSEQITLSDGTYSFAMIDTKPETFSYSSESSYELIDTTGFKITGTGLGVTFSSILNGALQSLVHDFRLTVRSPYSNVPVSNTTFEEIASENFESIHDLFEANTVSSVTSKTLFGIYTVNLQGPTLVSSNNTIVLNTGEIMSAPISATHAQVYINAVFSQTLTLTDSESQLVSSNTANKVKVAFGKMENDTFVDLCTRAYYN